MSYPYVKLEDICVMGSGGTPSRSKMETYYGGTIPWVKSGELKENTILSTEETITEIGLHESSAKLVPKGSLLIAMYGATVGRLAVLGVDAATNQAVCHLRPKSTEVIDSSYLFRVLQTKVPEWLAKRVGGAQPNISQAVIRNTKIPLPPLPEQKRIAAILDKADAICRKREKAIELTHSFLRSVFLEMFGDPISNPRKLQTTPLSKIARIRRDSVQPEKIRSGSKYIGLEHIEKGGRIVATPHVETGELASNKFIFDDKDILFGKLRPYLCKVAAPDFAGICSTDILPLTPLDPTLSDLPSQYLRMPSVVRLATERSIGANLPRLSPSTLASFDVPVPSSTAIKEYNQYVCIVKTLETHLTISYRKSVSLVASLSQTIFSSHKNKNTCSVESQEAYAL